MMEKQTIGFQSTLCKPFFIILNASGYQRNWKRFEPLIPRPPEPDLDRIPLYTQPCRQIYPRIQTYAHIYTNNKKTISLRVAWTSGYLNTWLRSSFRGKFQYWRRKFRIFSPFFVAVDTDKACKLFLVPDTGKLIPTGQKIAREDLAPRRDRAELAHASPVAGRQFRGKLLARWGSSLQGLKTHEFF